MSSAKSNQPKVTSRKSKGSVVSTTYEFPYKPAEKSLGTLIYDNQKGTVLGRTPKNWGEFGCVAQKHTDRRHKLESSWMSWPYPSNDPKHTQTECLLFNAGLMIIGENTTW